MDKAKELFRDLRSVIPCLEKLSGTGWTDVVEDSIRFSDEFLTHYQEVFIIRIKEGNVRDVHGDLHSRNIFLTPEPVIFDCIEFNATFRQIDVWYEVAFLCMEMEYYGHRDFSMEFFKEYTRVKQELVTSKDMEIFTYFKMLRANIRAKVLALQASEEISIPSGENLSESIRYLGLMKTYIEELKKGYLRKT